MLFRSFIIFSTAYVTTGIGFGVNGPASPVALALETHIPTSLTATLHRSARDYDSGTTTSDVDTPDANLLAMVSGIIRNGVNAGNLAIRYKSENSSESVTVKTGSILRWRLLN